MNLIRERFKKIKRLNIASSIHDHRLLNHIYKMSDIFAWEQGLRIQRNKDRLDFEMTISLLTEGDSGELPK